MADLQTPPTEIEVAELNHALRDFGPLGGVLRRLVFQRDKLEAEVEGLRGHWQDPVKPPAKPGLVWVRWRSKSDEKEYASVAHFEPADGFVFVKEVTEPERFDNYTFDYIGTVTGWQSIQEPAV